MLVRGSCPFLLYILSISVPYCSKVYEDADAPSGEATSSGPVVPQNESRHHGALLMREPDTSSEVEFNNDDEDNTDMQSVEEAEPVVAPSVPLAANVDEDMFAFTDEF